MSEVFYKRVATNEKLNQILELQRDNVASEILKGENIMNAHLTIGFKILYSYHSNSQDWNILYYQLNTDK